MNKEELQRKLNKSLKIEMAIAIIPAILAPIMTIFTFLAPALANYFKPTEETTSYIITSFQVLGCIIVLTLLVIKMTLTIKAMNSSINYFKQENDVKFRAYSSDSKVAYIIANIMLFIPIINYLSYVVFVYNLILWFKIRDRLNENTQTQNNQENASTENNNIELDKQS